MEASSAEEGREKRFVVLAKKGPVLSKSPLLIPGGLAYAEKVAT